MRGSPAPPGPCVGSGSPRVGWGCRSPRDARLQPLVLRARCVSHHSHGCPETLACCFNPPGRLKGPEPAPACVCMSRLGSPRVAPGQSRGRRGAGERAA